MLCVVIFGRSYCVLTVHFIFWPLIKYFTVHDYTWGLKSDHYVYYFCFLIKHEIGKVSSSLEICAVSPIVLGFFTLLNAKNSFSMALHSQPQELDPSQVRSHLFQHLH